MARSLRRDKGIARINVRDIVGSKCGKLTVLEYHGSLYDNTAGGNKYRHAYLCQCECGRFVVVRRQCLQHNRSKSCGCYKEGRGKNGS